MNPKQILRHPIETLRTAPFGLSLLISGLCIAGASAPEIADGTLEKSDVANVGTVAAVVGMGTLTVRKQFTLRAREEKFLEKHGYDDRYFANTTTEWCDRQTTRVVCAKYGVLDKYVAICEKNQQNDYLTYIPHI